MASFNYNEYQKDTNKTQNKPKSNFSYFSLKKNGEEAIVRFMYNSPEDFKLFTVHSVQVNGKWRKIDCLNTPYAPTNPCPLCAQGNKAQRKFFIKLLQYVRDPETNEIKALPKIWERSDKYADTLSNLFNEYGTISDSVFKIKRNGDNGDVNTSYDIMYASPAIYKAELYVKDEDAFKDFDYTKGLIISKPVEELNNLLSSNDKQNDTQPLPQNQPQTTNYTQSNLDFNNQPQQPRRTFTY